MITEAEAGREDEDDDDHGGDRQDEDGDDATDDLWLWFTVTPTITHHLEISQRAGCVGYHNNRPTIAFHVFPC